MSEDDIPDQPPPGGQTRLAYGAEPSQFGDLRLPGGEGPYPVAVVLHGGYWRARYGLGYMGQVCEALGRVGIATWNVEYSRVGEAGGGWPGTFQDVARALVYIARLPARFDLDVSRVLAIGHSAGGQLASWLSSAHRVGSLVPDLPDHIPSLRGVVSLAGVLDLQRAWQLGLSNMAVVELLGGTPDQFPERYAATSPLELVPTCVYHVLVHGTADTDVPYELSERYVLAAENAGDQVDFISLGGEDHFSIVDAESAAWGKVLPSIRGALKV